MKFTKMQGCGNDYIYIYTGEEAVTDKPELARRLSDRNFGIGGDGVIFINPTEKADFEMEMYNADGSYGAMCGNGIRCVAKYVYDNGLTDKNPVTIESGGSLKTLYLTVANGKVEKVRVDMGKPEFRPDKIPADTGAFAECGGDSIVNAMYTVNGRDYRVTAVSMGNPHAVIFTNDADSLDLVRDGPLFEHHKAFPEGVNTEFIKVLDWESIRMRVWERGSGETLACGTGACSAVAACVLNGLTGRSVKVFLKGGELDIEWNEEDGHIYMTGPAVTVFRGEI